MKTLLKLLLPACAAALLLIACDQVVPLPTRMENFVSSVEKNAANYSQDDWEQANAKFQKLCDEFTEKKGSLTGDEVKQVNKAMGRYAAVVLKTGIDSVGKGFNDAMEEVGSFLEGLSSGADKE